MHTADIVQWPALAFRLVGRRTKLSSSYLYRSNTPSAEIKGQAHTRHSLLLVVPLLRCTRAKGRHPLLLWRLRVLPCHPAQHVGMYCSTKTCANVSTLPLSSLRSELCRARCCLLSRLPARFPELVDSPSSVGNEPQHTSGHSIAQHGHSP